MEMDIRRASLSAHPWWMSVELEPVSAEFQTMYNAEIAVAVLRVAGWAYPLLYLRSVYKQGPKGLLVWIIVLYDIARLWMRYLKERPVIGRMVVVLDAK